MPAFAVAARLFLAASLLVAGGAHAQTQGAADPPGRVGRLSQIEGTVSARQPEQEQWAPAVLNYPVTQGMSFWTEPGARAEIQTGGANVRLDQSTELNVARLDDDTTQLRVEQGSANVTVASVPPGGVSVLTPQGEANLLRPGRYRIDVQPEQSEVSVLDGEARVNQTRASADLRAGESAVLAGDGFSRREARATPIDEWAQDRERQLAIAAQSDSGRYVSRAIPGYQDLEQHGRWRTVSDLGPVWYPTVTPNWAPYRYGHWAYVSPWGWTWIDDAPWGFAPFHYGRWVRDDYGWGWYPGPVVARPVYAPALVAFIGGAGWGVSIASGPRAAVGWVPLAPREVFRPYYRASRNHIRNVNITQVNQTVINNVTVNRTRNVTVNNFANQGAATVVPTATFTRAAKVQQAAVELPKQQLAAAPVSTQLAHLKPTAAARAGSAPAQASTTATPAATNPTRPAQVSRQPVRERAATADAPAPQAPGPAARPQAVAPRQEARPGAPARPQAAPSTTRDNGNLSRIAPAAGPIPAAPTPAAPKTGEPRRADEPQAKPQTQAAPGPAVRPVPRQTPDRDERNAPRAGQPPAAAAQPPAVPRPSAAPTVAQPPRRDNGEPQTRPQPQAAPSPPATRTAPAQQATPAPTPQARPSPPAPPQPSATAPRPPAPPQAARTEPPRAAPPPPVRAEPPRQPPPPAVRAEPPRPPAPPVVRAEPPRPAPPPPVARPAPPPPPAAAARPAPPPQAPPPAAARAAPPPQQAAPQPQRAPAKPASPQQDEKKKGG